MTATDAPDPGHTPGHTPARATTSEKPFLSEGVRCAMRVFGRRPGDEASRRPIIVMAHGFGGVRALRLYAYAERFAAEGYLVAVFDYRGFGDSDGEPRQLLGVKRQHADWRAAIAHARTLPGVDPDRVVAWGTSFAGGHVLALAGRGERLAAVIAQVPHVSGPAAVRATGVRGAMRLSGPAVRDAWAAARGHAPTRVPCVGAPGATAVMTSPDAQAGMARLIEASGLVDGDYPTDVAARITITIGLYSPRRHARRITCPTLMQIAEHDAVTPARIARATAARIPDAVVRTYAAGHFDPYVPPLFDTVIADQIAFLRERVPVDA